MPQCWLHRSRDCSLHIGLPDVQLLVLSLKLMGILDSFPLISSNILWNVCQLKGEITYETKDSAYCYMVVGVPEDICSLSANVTKWLSDVESCKVLLLGS